MTATRTESTLVVCEDDPLTLKMLCENLVADQFRVLAAPSASDALRLAHFHQPDLMLLDFGLPDTNGLGVLRTIRGQGDFDRKYDPELPVILLSGCGTEQDRVRCLESGADDFVMKPVDYRELLARIRTVLRRSRRGSRERISVGRLVIDRVSRRVTVDGREVRLNRKEYRLLYILASEPDRVFTKEELLSLVWGHDSLVHSRTLESHASRLRRKLDPEGSRYVINDWGVGYKLER